MNINFSDNSLIEFKMSFDKDKTNTESKTGFDRIVFDSTIIKEGHKNKSTRHFVWNEFSKYLKGRI
jgi:hypothetical protein